MSPSLRAGLPYIILIVVCLVLAVVVVAMTQGPNDYARGYCKGIGGYAISSDICQVNNHMEVVK